MLHMPSLYIRGITENWQGRIVFNIIGTDCRSARVCESVLLLRKGFLIHYTRLTGY